MAWWHGSRRKPARSLRPATISQADLQVLLERDLQSRRSLCLLLQSGVASSIPAHQRRDSYRPPPPPPPPPPPEEPPPPPPELLPGGVTAEEICELRLEPIDLLKSPRLVIGPCPLYHAMRDAASAAAAAPTAAVNFSVQASSTSSATA